MASRALTTKVDWNKVMVTSDKLDLTKINKLKSQIDSTVAKCSQLPESLPKIDWAQYKAHASDPKAVEELEKRYNAIKVEPPKIPASRLDDLELAKKQDLERFRKYAMKAQSFVESAEIVKNKFAKMIPVKDMSYEEWAKTFPYWSYQADNPSIGPHLGRSPGLSVEEAIEFEKPDPLPFSTPTAWKNWEERKKQHYS